MTTQEAITLAKKLQGEKMSLLSLENTYIYTNDGVSFNLIIKGSHSLGFGEIHAAHVEQDLEYYTKSINWLAPISSLAPNTGTTATYERAWKRGNHLLSFNRSK